VVRNFAKHPLTHPGWCPQVLFFRTPPRLAFLDPRDFLFARLPLIVVKDRVLDFVCVSPSDVWEMWESRT
jgi:hypothetical protein